MATPPVTLDFSTAIPIGGAEQPAPSPASTLQQSMAYGATQDPDQYAKLLQLKKQTGLGPEITKDRQPQIQQAIDVNSIDYPQFAVSHPRTTAWASDPDNAAVAGVSEIQRLASIEANAGEMRAATPWESFQANTIQPAFRALMGYPLTRMGIDAVAGTSGLVGNIGTYLGVHGDGSTKQNLLQRIETGLDPSQTGGYANGAPDKDNGMDWLAKNVAPMIPAVLGSGGATLLARTLGISETAAKVLAGLTVGGMFTADQGGKTYTSVAGAGGSDDAARLAANRVTLINALPNALFGATDLVPYLRDNPFLTSLGIGGLTGASGQVGQNVVTGKPTMQGTLSAALQGMAMQGGMHLGSEAFFGNLAAASDAVAESKLGQRAPDKLQEALQGIFEGDASLRIPAEQFSSYFKGKSMDPAAVAKGIGSTNYTEAVMSGGDVEVPTEGFLGKLDPEHQQALLADVVDPSTGLTLNQHKQGIEELQQFATGGGAEQLLKDTAAADAETAASPEYLAVKEQLRQRYTDAGETPEVAETLATKDANAYSNLARNAGMKPTELLDLYNPKVTLGEAPQSDLEHAAVLKQGGNFGTVHDEYFHDANGAVERLLADKGGEAAAALHHPDVGDIDLVYGKEGDASRQYKGGFGLAKIAAKHPEVLDDLQGFIDGLKVSSRTEDRINLSNENGKAGVRLSFDGKLKKWLLTAFRTDKEALPAAESGNPHVTDRAEPAPTPAGQEAGNSEESVARNGSKSNPNEPDILYQADTPQRHSASGADGQEPEPSEQPRGWFRVLPDGSYEIGRTKVGDLSTFIHEPGHAYLKIIGDLAKRDGASDVLKDDHQKILDFLGAKDGEPFTREQQETWARANEQYLREGSAPSSGLKGVFQRFGIWLHSIYSKASDLGVELTPEIRGVMDRLYASEEGVNRAETEAGPQAFSSAEEAGWTDEQFKKYAEAKGIEVDQAKTEILQKLNEAALRAKSEDWRKEESNVRGTMTAEVDQRPEYSAIRGLRKGELDDGTELTMSRDKLAEQFGEDRVKALQKQHPGLYRNEGGTDPETAAEALGFSSASEMIKALEAAPRRSEAIDNATRDYMTAKYGDIRYDGTMKDAADLAVMNEQRAQRLHQEMTALQRRNEPEFELRAAQRELKNYEKDQADQAAAKETKATAKDMTSLADGLLKENAQQQGRIAARDQKIAELKSRIADLEKSVAQAKQEGQAGNRFAQAVAPLASYREAAQQMIESKSAADLQPDRYLTASRKFAQEAFEALGKGDYWGAKQAKHKELMNHFLYREAMKAQDYLGKFESYGKRMQTPGPQGKLGLAGSDYRDQFNYLMGRYNIGRPAAAAPERPLAEWAMALHADGKEPAIDPVILNEKPNQNYRTVPIAEVRKVHDALINIKKLADQELGIEVNGKKIEFAKAVSDMAERAKESLTAKPERVLTGNATAGEKASDWAQRGNALLMRTEFLVERLDGGAEGPWHDNLWHLASDAQGDEYALQEAVTKRIGDALKNMPKEQRMRMLDKVDIDGIPETVSRHDLVSMALNMGNQGNLERLEKTFVAHGWDTDSLWKIQGSLTREEWQFVQDTWDSLKPLGDRMSELEQRLTGLPPVMVKPTPLSVKTTDGTEMNLSGGYYPVAMDPRYSTRGALQDSDSTQNLMEAGYGRATTSRGYTKARTGFGGPLLLDYEQVLTQHTAKVIKDISHREFMLVANKLLLDPTIRQTVRETLGAGHEEQMMPWLRTIINDRNGSAVQGLGAVSQILRSLRTNLVKAALTFKASTVLLQVTHASSMFNYTSPGSYGQAMVDFMAHPQAMSEEIRNLSPNEMASRGENIDRDLRTLIQTETGQKGIGHTIARAGMMPVQFMDHVMSFPLWLSVYRDALTEHAALPEKEAQYQAMQKADGAVRMGLGSNAPKDLPPLMRNNDFTKLITTLGGFHNLKWNQMSQEVHGASNGGSVGKLTYGVLMAAVIPAVLGQLVTGYGPKDGENPGLWAAKRALLFPVETLPVFGNIAQAMERRGDVSFSPLASMAERASKVGAQATSESENKDWTGMGLNALQTAMDGFGVTGTDQAFKTASYLRQVNKGKVENPNAWDAVVGSARH